MKLEELTAPAKERGCSGCRDPAGRGRQEQTGGQEGACCTPAITQVLGLLGTQVLPPQSSVQRGTEWPWGVSVRVHDSSSAQAPGLPAA